MAKAHDYRARSPDGLSRPKGCIARNPHNVQYRRSLKGRLQ
jgi:hypothetical protein